MIVKIVSVSELSPGGWTNRTVTTSAVARRPQTATEAVRVGAKKGSTTECRYFPKGTPCTAPASAHVFGMEFHARRAINAATGKKRSPAARVTANRLRKTRSAHAGVLVPA